MCVLKHSNNAGYALLRYKCSRPYRML
jgi:hypothetical protein